MSMTSLIPNHRLNCPNLTRKVVTNFVPGRVSRFDTAVGNVLTTSSWASFISHPLQDKRFNCGLTRTDLSAVMSSPPQEALPSHRSFGHEVLMRSLFRKNRSRRPRRLKSSETLLRKIAGQSSGAWSHECGVHPNERTSCSILRF